MRLASERKHISKLLNVEVKFHTLFHCFLLKPFRVISVSWGEQRFLDSSLLLSKESKMIGDEILKLLARDQAPILLICLPPPAERLMLREHLGGVTVNAATDCFLSTDRK